MKYNWQHPSWPHFQYRKDLFEDLLYDYARNTGYLLGVLNTLPPSYAEESILNRMINEAYNSYKIEGEIVPTEDIMSSISNRLHPERSQLNVRDARAKGIAELMEYLYRRYKEPLSVETLQYWHSVLFKQFNTSYFNAGSWRTSEDTMQIVSGPIGIEKIYFEAPPASQVPEEMKSFILWVNSYQTKLLPGPIQAAIAHLYFESIHPFEDGNGRIGRAIAEHILANSMNAPCQFSISKAISLKQKNYYSALNEASSFTVEINQWILYFLEMLKDAQKIAKKEITFTVSTAKFWEMHETNINERQEKVLRRMFKEGVEGFVGGISTKKYISITDCSKATATRDLAELLQLGCLRKLSSGGRNTAYELNI